MAIFEFDSVKNGTVSGAFVPDFEGAAVVPPATTTDFTITCPANKRILVKSISIETSTIYTGISVAFGARTIVTNRSVFNPNQDSYKLYGLQWLLGNQDEDLILSFASSTPNNISIVYQTGE